MFHWNIKSRLATAPAFVLVLYTVASSFCVYFCMYAYRKPFAAGQYQDFETFWGLGMKEALVIGQLVGYTISKIMGVKFCSEIRPGRWGVSLVSFILWAEAALVAFALAPSGWKVAAMFLNGLPLGFIWGLVVRYLEGRQTSELLLAGLSCSFILASGVVKDVGRAMMKAGVSEEWMPAMTGLLFFPAFVISVFFLDQVPRPNTADVASRVERKSMMRRERRQFFTRYWLGLLLLFAVYMLVTAYRDFRDNYGVEIFNALGYENATAIFTRTEVPVAFGVLTALAALSIIKDHRRALAGAYVLMISGLVCLVGGTLLLDAGFLKDRELWWMILVGLGTYLVYVPYSTILFERLLASTQTVGTAVFAIYVADALGYTTSVGMQLYKTLGHAELSHFEFFRKFTYILSAVGVILLVTSCFYFLGKTTRGKLTPEP